MASRSLRTVHTLWAVLLLACAPGSGVPDGTRAVFQLTAGEGLQDPAQLPFPFDLFRAQSGGVAASSLPVEFPNEEMEQVFVDALGRLDGFGVTSAVFFPVNGEVAPSSLTQTSARMVALVEDESGAPALQEVPCEARYHERLKAVVVRPRRGATLREATRHGVVLTTDVTDPNGRPLVAGEDFHSALDAPEGDGPLGRAHSALAPLIAALEREGLPRDRIAAATVYTTQRVTADLMAIRKQMGQASPPKAELLKLYPDADTTLDDLLGQPTFKRPGFDSKESAVLHDALAYVIHGTFDAPLYVTQEPGEGTFAQDAKGQFVVRQTQKIWFTLALPSRASYAEVPVVIYQHGINGERSRIFAVANSLAEAGIATIGIDTFLHGSRMVDGTDKVNNITGAAGPDHIGDYIAGVPMVHFFAINGRKGYVTLHPEVVRDNMRQSVVDMMQLARLLAEGDWSAVRAASPALAALSFDAEHIVFTGHSFGALLGSTFIAVDPIVRAAAVQGGGGGLLFPLVANSPEYFPLMSVLSRTQLDRKAVVDQPDKLPVRDQLTFNLFQTILDRGDPIAFAPYVLSPPDGGSPKHVLYVQAHADESLPNHSTEATAAAMGLPFFDFSRSVPPPRYAAFSTAESGLLRGNLADGKATGALCVYHPGSHSTLEHHDGFREYEIDFPPFVRLDETLRFPNPTEQLQAQLVHFVASYVATGVPEIIDPYATP